MKHRADLSIFGICDASDYTRITPSFLGCSTFRDLSRMPQPGSGNQSHTEVRKSSNLKPVTLLALDLIPGGIRGTSSNEGKILATWATLRPLIHRIRTGKSKGSRFGFTRVCLKPTFG